MLEKYLNIRLQLHSLVNVLPVLDFMNRHAQKHVPKRDPINLYLIQIPRGHLFLALHAAYELRTFAVILLTIPTLTALLIIILIIFLHYRNDVIWPMIALKVYMILRI